jgi:hypothetical protein
VIWQNPSEWRHEDRSNKIVLDIDRTPAASIDEGAHMRTLMRHIRIDSLFRVYLIEDTGGQPLGLAARVVTWREGEHVWMRPQN